MPLLWLSLAFVIGILLAELSSLPAYTWLILCALGVALILAEKFILHSTSIWKRVRLGVPVYPGLLLLIISLGMLRAITGQPVTAESSLANYNGRGTYTITGRVNAPPDQRENAVYLDISAIEIEDPLASDPYAATWRVSGNARVRFPASVEYRMGEVLRFTGDPLTPSDGERFSYKDYLERQHIATVVYHPRQVSVVEIARTWSLRAALEDLRQGAREVIFSIYPQPESSLLAGILLGLEQDIPDSLKKAYQQSGTAHIIAISGFNMGVLAAAFSYLFNRFFNRYLAALVSAMAIILYTVFVGASPSVVRAAIMAVSAFGGHLVGRRQSGANALAFTAALMCAVNPLLISDVSFQLSFSATLGLVLFAEPLGAWAKTRLGRLLPETAAARIAEPVSNYLLFTLAAQLLTLPIIAYHFGRISLVSLLANPLILPVQPPLLILGGISAIAGAVSPLLGRVAVLFVWPLAAYSNFIAERFSRLDWGSLIVNARIALYILAIIILFVLLFVFRTFFTKVFKGRFYWIIFLLLMGAVTVFSILLHQPDGNLHLHLLHTGEETVLMLKTPSGQTVLFDPGNETNEISAAISRQLSPWRFQIDQVWLSNSGGARYLAEINERIPVKSVILPPVVYLAGAESKPVAIPTDLSPVKLAPGEEVVLNGNLTICVVAESLDSAALFITHGAVKMLIPNGVDYALIREQNAAALDDLSILVLGEADISYIPPRVWLAHHPQLVVWNSPALSPAAGWYSLDFADQISILSNGQELFIETEN